MVVDIGECRRVFRKVKQAVKCIVGIERPGLTLAMQRLPPYIEAYHPIGTHYIVVNRDILDELFSRTGDRDSIEAYLFPLLLHEYLHSFGFDENYTYHLTVDICSRLFGENSLAMRIARYGISTLAGRRKAWSRDEERDLEIIGDLDLENQSYII
ncbi:MAG: hypothetical protein QXQ29_05405 [Candidatus Bathyarchaeia archaeon]